MHHLYLSACPIRLCHCLACLQVASAPLQITVAKFPASWGQGTLEKKNGKYTGLWHFTPNIASIKPNSVLVVKYTITDIFGASAAGKVQLKFVGEALPTQLSELELTQVLSLS